MGVCIRFRKIKDNKKTYYLDIFHNGQRWVEFLKIHSSPSDPDRKEKKELLESIRSKRALELNCNDYQYIPQFKRTIDFIEYYQEYLNNYKKRDIRMIKYSLKKFKEFIGTDKIQVQKVDSALCERFKDYLKYKANLTGETPHNYFSRFKKVVKQAYKEKVLSTNSAEDIRLKISGKSNLKKNILTKDELQLLALTPCGNEQVKRAFLFACYSGLGIAELRKLNKSHIRNNKLRINREKTKEEIWNDLSPTALKILEQNNASEGNIFVLPSDTGVNKVLATWMKKASVDKRITFYCGRHTFASQLLLNGANLKTVADLMGHTSTKHTVKYLNYVDSLKTEAIRSLPEIMIQ